MNATVTIERIGAKKAQHYLATIMDSQRPIREGHVLRLATEIENNNWHLTSDAIMLVKGRLANGQHRLHAVMLAEKECDFLVLKTDDEEVYKVLDSGIGRTAGDALHHLGIGMGKEVAAVSMLVLQFDRCVLTAFGTNRDKVNRITRSDVVDYVEEHQKALEKEVHEVLALRASRPILPVSLGAALLHLANRGGKGDGWAFIRSLYLGGTNDAVHDLRERFIRNNTSKVKLTRQYKFALLVKTYRSFVNGTRPGTLKMIEGESFPKMP